MNEFVIVHTPQLLSNLDKLGKIPTIDDLSRKVKKLRLALSKKRPASGTSRPSNGRIRISRKYLLGELEQIEKTLTIERAQYYLRRLQKAISESKTTRVNDMNLRRWKEYEEIFTDSLWVVDRRDSSGAHSAWYWGNFIPQIPRQLMLRYTKKGEWVLDTFAGSGTTLLECQRLGRNGLGVELQKKVVSRTTSLLRKEGTNNNSASVTVEIGDSCTVDFAALLKKRNAASAQLVILHPPYHDIIRFSRKRSDLSNARSTGEFLNMFGAVVENVGKVLDRNRYLAVVIGDKYEKGEWVPLGFLAMSEVMKRGFRLKSIVVKNFDGTLGKRNRKELWRYRALAGGFYVFKHEYVLIFQKRENKAKAL